MSEASTKPYLIRAIHEWCSDNGFTPYLAVAVDQTTQVPREYVRAGEIVLNVSLEATNKLQLGNDYVEFQARFGGQARDIVIPIANVSAIYARENGHGMSFEVAKPLGIVDGAVDAPEAPQGAGPMPPASAGRAPRGGPRGLSSVKPSAAPKGDDAGTRDAKRPAPRKLKSVSTGDRGATDPATISTPQGELVVSMAPESTSESSKSKVDHLAPESGAASASQDTSRTAAAPRPVAQPQKKSEVDAAEIKEVSPTPSTKSDSETGSDAPPTDPSKPTGGKPKLTRVK
jgi:stringent starvation protein B